MRTLVQYLRIPSAVLLTIFAAPGTTYAQTFEVVHAFDGGAREPNGPVVFDGAGGLIFTIFQGGVFRKGTVQRTDPVGGRTRLHDFAADGSEGIGPVAPLTPWVDGWFAGSTSNGGLNDHGTLFAVRLDGTFSVLHVFDGSDGDSPSAPFVRGADGALYGSTAGGGPSGKGVLFKLTRDGFSVLHSFSGSDGQFPGGGMIGGLDVLTVGADGAIYGTTVAGAQGYGTIFRIASDDTVTTIHEFGGRPTSPLVHGPDGALYGSQAPASGTTGSVVGSIFRVSPDGSFSIVRELTPPLGLPQRLTVGADGLLYAATSGGSFNKGVLFRISTTGVLTVLSEFEGIPDAGSPQGGLVLAADGALYGISVPLVLRRPASVYRFGADGTFSIIPTLSISSDGGEVAPLAVGEDGAVYGTWRTGGTAGAGSIFRVGLDGTFTEVESFGIPGGSGPDTALVTAADGAMYGIAGAGTFNRGVFYRLVPGGTLTPLHNFDATEGWAPYSDLVEGIDGALFGVSRFGGTAHDLGLAAGVGSAFRMRLDGTLTVLHDFESGTHPNGAFPRDELARGSDGALYGVTETGGAHGAGTIFRIAPDGGFTTIHHFASDVDGLTPRGPLTPWVDGALYGVAASGGNTGPPSARSGTVYRVWPDGTFTLLHQFTGSDGSGPHAPLVPGPDNALYGMTGNGGAHNNGTIFKVNADGTVDTIHSFSDAEGWAASLTTPLVFGADGALYGRTGSNRAGGDGALFRVESDGTLTIVHPFAGEGVAAPLTRIKDRVYGATSSGGEFGGGMIYAIEPDGTFTILKHLNLEIDGAGIERRFELATDGNVYGVAPFGGPRGGGVVFRLVDSRAGQEIALAPLTTRYYGDPDFVPDVSVSSGLPLTLQASGSCSMVNGAVHLDGVGTCNVTASQPGNATYLPSQPVSQSFGVFYSWSGVRPPLARHAEFKAGRTIAVTFQLTGASAAVTQLQPTIEVVQTSTSSGERPGNGQPGGEPDASGATIVGTFVYRRGQYVYDLDTTSMKPGSWDLHINLLDGDDHVVPIVIRE